MERKVSGYRKKVGLHSRIIVCPIPIFRCMIMAQCDCMYTIKLYHRLGEIAHCEFESTGAMDMCLQNKIGTSTLMKFVKESGTVRYTIYSSGCFKPC